MARPNCYAMSACYPIKFLMIISPDSDIDVLVEFEPGHVPGLALIRMQDELSALLGGRQVDLVTPKFLHPRIRDRVLTEMEIQYAQG